MPSGSSADGDRTFRPLPPPKRQLTFGSKRKTATPPTCTPPLNKRQSSLTQLWTDSPMRVVDNSSGEDDEDYNQPPPKRRRKNEVSLREKGKKTKLEWREPGQSSFTQVDYLALMRGSRRSDVDETRFQVWHDYDQEEDLKDRKHTTQDASFDSAWPSTKIDDAEKQVPESPWSSQKLSTLEQHCEYAHSKVGRTEAQLNTPQKVRVIEVPSSQTPTSAEGSAQKLVRPACSISRSPLKEKNINVQACPKKPRSPESQSTGMKMLERTRFTNQRAQQRKPSANAKVATTDEDLVQCAAEATDDFSLRTCPLPPQTARKLHRTTTVQDSQAEDSETISQTISSESESPRQQKSRRLSRVTAAEDIWCDGEGTALEDYAPTHEQDDAHYVTIGNDDDFQTNNDYLEGTFDPAFSALDRDANRYGLSQTEQRVPVTAEDSETQEEEPNQRCSAKVQQQTKAEFDKASQDLGEPLAPINRQPPGHCDDREGRGREEVTSYDSADESGDRALGIKDVEVPSSPPPPICYDESAEDNDVPSSPPALRPSQVSTVVPTQASVVRRPPSPLQTMNAESYFEPATPRHQQETQAFTFLSSPEKPNSLWQPKSLISSPLPLPPWSSPEKLWAFRVAHGTDHNAGAGVGSDAFTEDLVDFSLPPPPPISSSRRQTPASSSL